MVARGRPPRQTRECEPRPDSCCWLNGLVSRPGSLQQSPRQLKLSKATKLATRLEGGGRWRCWHWHQRGERWHSDAKARLQFTSLTSGGRLVQDLPGARALCRSVSLHQPQLRGWEWILADKSWTWKKKDLTRSSSLSDCTGIWLGETLSLSWHGYGEHYYIK